MIKGHDNIRNRVYAKMCLTTVNNGTRYCLAVLAS